MNPQETTNQDPFIDLQSIDPEHAVTFKKFADIPTRFTSTLKRFSCTHAIFPNNENALICLKGTNTIKDILDSFFGHHIKAIPIVDEAKHPQNVVSQASLLKALVPFLMEYNKSSNTSDIQEFLQRRIADVPEVLERPVILPQASYAFDAFQMMQKHPNQRILIVNNLEENILTNIVSETRLTEVLCNLVDDMEDVLKNATIEKVIQNKTQVSCEIVNCQASAMEAFCLLASKNLESVAVVGENGKLLSVLTPADIKGVGADLKGCSLLQEPVEAFLQHIRNPHELEEIKPNVIACHLQDTVHNLLKKFVYWKVHRVLVADQEERFVTDITLLDVMTYFQDHEHTIPEEHHLPEHRAVNFTVNVQ